MLDIIRTFFAMYWYVVIPVVTLMFLVIPVIVYWYEVRYWLMGLRINMPWLGRISHWVKNPGSREAPSDIEPTSVGFYESESQLCGLYETYYRNHQPSELNFRRCQDYLGKIDEDNRKEKGMGLWALIIVLMVIEASAFGFALAPFALTMATPNTAIAAAFAIGLVISIIALCLSEFAGRQMYLNSVVAKILSYENMRGEGSTGDMIRTNLITIDNTYDDNEKAHYQQMLNRVKLPKDGEKPGKRFGLIVAYSVFILGLAVAAFWVRAETLNGQTAELIGNPPAVTAADDFPVTAADDDFPLPGAMEDMATSAVAKSAQDQIDAMHRASLVTFAVLSGLFIFIQLTSTFLAYTFGFAGTHSRVAWELIRKFASADEFVRYHAAKARDVATDAQQSLGKLQALQLNVFRANGTDREQLRKDTINRRFTTYITEQDAKVTRALHNKTLEKLGQDSQQVIRNYIEKAIASLNTAIAVEDNVRIQEIISSARPRFAQIKDPTLFPYRDAFNGIVEMFLGEAESQGKAPAPVPAAAQAAQPAPTPAPAPAPAQPVETEAVADVKPVEAVKTDKPAAFDPYQFGDLTAYHEDDLEFVAARKGVDVSSLTRARRLQLLDQPTKQPV